MPGFLMRVTQTCKAQPVGNFHPDHKIWKVSWEKGIHSVCFKGFFDSTRIFRSNFGPFQETERNSIPSNQTQKDPKASSFSTKKPGRIFVDWKWKNF